TRRHFDASSVFFSEIDSTAENITIVYDLCEPGADSLVGTYCLADFLSKDWLARLAEGRTLPIDDIALDPETARFASAYRALGIHAQIHAPYLSDGRWKFLLCIQSREPRAWRQDEVDLMHELSARIWLRLERARAEEAHRASEERYRTLFHSIDQGFCVFEM